MEHSIRRPVKVSSEPSPTLSLYNVSVPAERLLLFLTIIILPMDNHIPAIGGFSSLYILFGILGGYVLLFRPAMLDGVWMHPVFLAAYAFLLVTSLLEFSSPLSSYSDILRIAQMVVGGIFVAALCRDRRSLTTCLYAYIGAALWLSFLLLLTSYGTLQSATATDFQEASDVRAEAFKGQPLQGNINQMAATAAQGGIIALAMALTNRVPLRQNVFFGIAVICLLASFMPMSRGGIINGIASCATVLALSGFKHIRVLVLGAVLSAILVLLVPNAIWSRMVISTDTRARNVESRTYVYSTALRLLPEYALTGVGAGNFWHKWGFKNGFATGSARSLNVGGAHNCFLQVTINWGALGLMSFSLIIWQAYRCIPRNSGKDSLALALVGFGTSLVLLMFVMHDFHDKRFALGLGMLVGAKSWIWPDGQPQKVV